MNTHKPKPIIVLLHFAGGNCYSFQFLKPYLEAYNVVIPELPGRGKRTGEDLICDKAQAVDDLVDQLLKQQVQGDLIIYGHSMGATLALLLCEKLEQANIHPACLVVTGSCGPGVGKKEETYKLKGEAFKHSLRRLGGISELVLQEEELFAYFEPVIRADFELLEKDSLEPAAQLCVPLHAIMGADEDDVAHIRNWQRFTSSKATTEIWPGNHFFIHDHPERLAELLKKYSDNVSHHRQKLPSSYMD